VVSLIAFSFTPRDPFIVCTSNIFAILGLRAMYFLLLVRARSTRTPAPMSEHLA
jgi:predicted tellurium resistance membrane protein TerC